MGLGHNDPWVESHIKLNRCGVKGHLGVTDLWFKFLQKRSLYPHTLMYFHGTWTQCGNTSMYVDTVINFAKITTYIHIHTTYILHTYTYYILRTESVIT